MLGIIGSFQGKQLPSLKPATTANVKAIEETFEDANQLPQ
jgi:hypothetical protein